MSEDIKTVPQFKAKSLIYNLKRKLKYDDMVSFFIRFYYFDLNPTLTKLKQSIYTFDFQMNNTNDPITNNIDVYFSSLFKNTKPFVQMIVSKYFVSCILN